MGPWAKRDDMVVHDVEPYNAEAPLSALAAHALTPVDAFYGRNHGPIPDIDPAAWRLELTGLVGRPLTLSLADLRAGFARSEVVATVQCAGNRRAGLQAVRPIPGETPWHSGAISTARWSGVSLAAVLAAARPSAYAAHVEFTAPDVAGEACPPQAYGSSIPLAKAMAGEVLLAWAMNDRPLPPVHGGPVRVVVPGYIGARSVKWVTRIAVRDRPSENYFQAVAYRLLPPAGPAVGCALGPVAVGGDILAPRDGEVRAAGPLEVIGYAVGGEGREVAGVEVSVDEGRTWRPAELGPSCGAWAWRHWHTFLDLPAGEVVIVARAWDAAADRQPESPAALWNPGGYANNSWPRVRLSLR